MWYLTHLHWHTRGKPTQESLIIPGSLNSSSKNKHFQILPSSVSHSFTHTLSPAVSYWLCISVHFPSPLLQWGINRHNWRNENLIIKDNSFVHIYTSAASTSCQVVSFILKSFPTLLVLLTGYEFSFPPSPSVAFYQQLSLYRSLPSGNDLSGPWEKKGKAWKTEFHVQRRAATLINTFTSTSTRPFHPFTPSFLLHSHEVSRFLSSWWMDERNLRSSPSGRLSVMFSRH